MSEYKNHIVDANKMGSEADLEKDFEFKNRLCMRLCKTCPFQLLKAPWCNIEYAMIDAFKRGEISARASEAAKYKTLVEATHELLYAVYTFFDPEAADEIWDRRVRKCAEDAKAILKALEGK